MTLSEILDITTSTRSYNFHSHTQFCDGYAPMEEMVHAAQAAGMLHYGFSPHSPIPIESPCNMSEKSVEQYIAEADRLQQLLADADSPLRLYKGMEIDRISHDSAPHIDYYRNLPLDYRIGSVHFVTSQEGIPIDCDGRFPRFEKNLREHFRSDLRYVVEKYFESVLLMLEEGGFDILGHADKIAANASGIDPEIESRSWYKALMDDVVRLSASTGVIVEINTKSIEDRGRFFPHLDWWESFIQAGIPLMVNSDAHRPEMIDFGRQQAFTLLDRLCQNSL